MSSLYKIKPDGELLEIERAPFSDEPKELENFIMKNERILGNIVLLNRQVTLPEGSRIDLWGLDTLERARAKVILVAPRFKKELLDVVDYLKLDIELIEIYRHKTNAGEFLVIVNKPQSTAPAKATVKVMEEWSWEKYQKEGVSEKKIEIAKGIKEQLDTILKREKIPLEPIFRKLYIPYQSGRSNVFWIDLAYTSWTAGDVLISFYLDKNPDLEAEGIKIEHTKTKWNEEYNLWSIFFNKAVDLSPLIPLIKKSYEYVTGQKLE